MPFNVIDGFNINASTPVDTRIVVSATSSRDSIQYKYNGLSVFVESDRKTYIYNSITSSWDSPFTGLANRLAVINSASNGITASIIQHNVNGITFKTNNAIITADRKITLKSGTGNYAAIGGGDGVFIPGVPGPGGYPPTFFPGGDVYAYGGEDFFGGSNGSLYLGYNPEIGAPTSGFVIVGDGGVVLNYVGFVPDTKFLVNMPTHFEQFIRLRALSEVNSGLVFNTTMPYSSVESAAYINSNSIYSTASTPDYTWLGDVKTGIYHPAANTLGISVNGNISMLANSTSTNIAINGATGLSLLSNKSMLMFGGSTVSISATAASFDIKGSIPFNGYTMPSKMRLTVNDIYANVHQQGTNGLGDSGNTPVTMGVGPLIGVATNGPWNYPSISSGEYSGTTASTVVNTSAALPSTVSWLRVGNTITVSGSIIFTVTTANIDASFKLNLPIESFFSDNSYPLNGIGKIIQGAAGANNGGGDVATITGSVNKAFFRFRPSSTGIKEMAYTYQYTTSGYLSSGFGGGGL